MQDEPTPTELIKAVADFLRNEITPVIKGHNAFKLRVGINALDLVARQLRSNLAAMPRKPAGFRDCWACKARSANSTARSPIALPRASVDLRTPDLADHLWQTTMDKLRGRSAELRVVQEGVGGKAKA